VNEPLDDEHPRTYSGWKATMAIIAVVALVTLAVNLVGERTVPRTERRPPVVVSVTPAP